MESLQEYMDRCASSGYPVERNEEFVLRHETDPVIALRACKSRFEAREKKYRKGLWEELATVYAQALHLDRDKEKRKDFYAEKYWHRVKPSRIKSIRDLFRDVCKYYVLVEIGDESGAGKRASKHAAVMTEMHAHDVFPDAVPGVIELSGGIERIARNGIPKPIYIDPRDLGDGMTRTGEVIIYPDEEAKKKAKRETMYVEGDELIHKRCEELGLEDGDVHIWATASVGRDGTTLRVYQVEPDRPAPERDPVGTPKGPDGMVMMPVYMSERRLRRVERMSKRLPVFLKLQKVDLPDGQIMTAVGARSSSHIKP